MEVYASDEFIFLRTYIAQARGRKWKHMNLTSTHRLVCANE